jgi:hypothetical protein
MTFHPGGIPVMLFSVSFWIRSHMRLQLARLGESNSQKISMEMSFAIGTDNTAHTVE